mgnify:FL=1|jgi:peptide/nickel transport system permease protein
MSSPTAVATGPPEKNKRRPKWREALARIAARFWYGRNVYLTAIGYLFLLIFFWMTAAFLDSGSATSVWYPPGDGHLFGINARGQDVFHASLAAGTKSISAALLAAFFGVGLSILSGWGIALSRRSAPSFVWLRRISRYGGFCPALIFVLIISAGWGAGFWKLVFLFSLVVLVFTLSRISDWFEELEDRGGTIAAEILGLTRSQTIRANYISFVAKRGIALACTLIPGLILGEIALSFVGFGLGPTSWGGLLAEGMRVLFEAPWLTIYPGFIITATLLTLSLLGWMARKSMNGDIPPRMF